MTSLTGYITLLLPGLSLFGVSYFLLRPLRAPLARIGVLILLFVFLRDAMTPAGLWTIGSTGGDVPVPWMRMTSDPVALLGIAAGSLLLVLLTLRDRVLAPLVRFPLSLPAAGVGLLGALLAAAPILLLSAGIPPEQRGGGVALSVLPALALMCLVGNLAEELIFRGYLQGCLERHLSGLRAALSTAVLFAACHLFLAYTVTPVGWPLVAFTLWEGLICALLRWRSGLPAAVIAHGGAIFLLSSGLF